MFGGRFSSSCGALGVDIGSRAIKLLQLSRSRSELQVVGAAEEPVSSRQQSGSADASAQDGTGADSNLSDRLRSAFTAGGFAGRQCVVSLPREDVFVQAVRLPRMPDAELRAAAAWEAADRFSLKVNEMEVDFLRTGASEGGESREEVLIIAAAHDVIHRRIHPILDAGLRPIAIDTHFGALARIFSRRFRRGDDRQYVRAVLEVGFSGSTALILQGNLIAFCKPIAIGGNQFNQAVAEHLQLDLAAAEELRSARILRTANSVHPTSDPHAEASTDRAVYEATRPLLGELVKEMTLCLRYYGVTFRGRPPYQILLTGGESFEPHLAELLQSGCKLPVAFDDDGETLGALLPGIQAKLHRTPGPAASWAVAAGLSVRELREAALPETAEIPQRQGERKEAA